MFSDEFSMDLANAGGDLSMMRPAKEGRAFIASDAAARLQYIQVAISHQERFSFITNQFLLVSLKQQTDNSLTYLNWGAADLAGVPYAQMRNQDGNVVAASLDSIQSAMDAVEDNIRAGTVKG